MESFLSFFVYNPEKPTQTPTHPDTKPVSKKSKSKSKSIIKDQETNIPQVSKDSKLEKISEAKEVSEAQVKPDRFEMQVSKPDDVSKADVSEPVITQVNVSEPVITQVNVSKHDVSKPDVSKPDISKPDISKPDVSKPDISKTNVTKPDISKPDVSKPDVSKTNVTKPDVSKTNVTKPDVSNHDVVPDHVSKKVSQKVSELQKKTNIPTGSIETIESIGSIRSSNDNNISQDLLISLSENESNIIYFYGKSAFSQLLKELYQYEYIHRCYVTSSNTLIRAKFKSLKMKLIDICQEFVINTVLQTPEDDSMYIIYIDNDNELLALKKYLTKMNRDVFYIIMACDKKYIDIIKESIN